MERDKVILEIGRWLYGLVVGAMLFLFFCLLLDVICFFIGGGWNTLLGQWPIFSGTLAAVFYDDFATVFTLLVGMAVIARLIIWDRVPGLLEFLVKHPD